MELIFDKGEWQSFQGPLTAQPNGMDWSETLRAVGLNHWGHTIGGDNAGIEVYVPAIGAASIGWPDGHDGAWEFRYFVEVHFVTDLTQSIWVTDYHSLLQLLDQLTTIGLRVQLMQGLAENTNAVGHGLFTNAIRRLFNIAHVAVGADGHDVEEPCAVCDPLETEHRARMAHNRRQRQRQHAAAQTPSENPVD